MGIDYKAWKRHFTKEPRSSETVAVPKDVFDFLVEAADAYQSIEGGDVLAVVNSQFLVHRLLHTLKDEHEGTA